MTPLFVGWRETYTSNTLNNTKIGQQSWSSQLTYSKLMTLDYRSRIDSTNVVIEFYYTVHKSRSNKLTLFSPGALQVYY